MVRLEFSVATRKAAYDRAKGRCEECGRRLGEYRPQYHHAVEASLGGTNELKNCVVLCPPCHRIVTKERRPEMDKTVRLERKQRGWTGRKAKIKSRGFEKYE
jgi:5-methylcytosine-specific restriction protein A